MSDDDYTRLIVHMEGANNSTTFTDASRCKRRIINTNVVISTAQSKWSNGSGYFNGSNAYLLYAPSPDLDCGTRPFTMGLWGYRTGGGIYATLIGNTPGSWQAGAAKLDWGNSGTNRLALISNGAGAVGVDSPVSFNVWHYIEIYRQDTTIGISIDGGSFNTATISASATYNWGYGSGMANGAGFDGGSQWFGGYIQDFRMVVGTVLHTSSFTPPSRLSDSTNVPSGVITTNYRSDLLDGGGYRIAGTVDRLGTSGSYRVRLFNRYDGRLVRQCWSNSDGTFAFDSLANRASGYFAVAHDHSGTALNAAISDLLTPVIMP